MQSHPARHLLILCLLILPLVAALESTWAQEEPLPADEEPPFQVSSFRVVEVREDTEEDWVEVLWAAVVHSSLPGLVAGRLDVVVSDSMERPIQRPEGPVRTFVGREGRLLKGRFRMSQNEWFRTESFDVDVEVVEPPIHISGLLLRPLRVLPGTPMALGDFAPMRWSAVVENPTTAPVQTTLRMHLWDGEREMVSAYPVNDLKIAAGSRVKLGALTVLDGSDLRQASSITVDALVESDPE